MTSTGISGAHVDTGTPPTVGSSPKVCSSYVVGWILASAGALGLAASLILTVEKFQLLADPSYRPSCSINPVLSCGSVMSSSQASIFGFPNSILGVVAFTVLLTTGIVTLTAANALPQWYWRCIVIGLFAGAVLVHWLIFQSLYRIQALCPYCMVVWVVTMTALWYATLHLATRRPASSSRTLKNVVALGARNHSLVPTIWVLSVMSLILNAFWDYWSTLV
ncbi:vitamin K epoxide reductase family protein [Rhodococcus sp. ARC_M6]|uniref:vitamin K epoxide reductase family protein n=1 Tax=Rhodococcus sp. ARC_M6 TaxID=2928852 RepID=UPI001FB2DD26|nr:vitamin K epoxide reductase family protein [Rhodococcus sp. ARC_M6]MCJ0905169.1 vitamin K epoxide reductase family protein [Rhodococcus sp. ARC_M6]